MEHLTLKICRRRCFLQKDRQTKTVCLQVHCCRLRLSPSPCCSVAYFCNHVKRPHFPAVLDLLPLTAVFFALSCKVDSARTRVEIFLLCERAQEAPVSFANVSVPSRPRPPAGSPSTRLLASPPALAGVLAGRIDSIGLRNLLSGAPRVLLIVRSAAERGVSVVPWIRATTDVFECPEFGTSVDVDDP